MARTALELTAEQWKTYDPAAAIQHRDTLQRAKLSRRKRRAMQLAHKAADLLKREYFANKVILFGSLAQPQSFTPWSDIDLAAWGISQERFYAAVAAVISLSSDIKISLLAPEDCSPDLLQSIQRHGKPL